MPVRVSSLLLCASHEMAQHLLLVFAALIQIAVPLHTRQGGLRQQNGEGIGGFQAKDSCNYADGMWIHDDGVRSRMRVLSKEARAADASTASEQLYPAEAYRGYDCELYTFAARLPGMAGYTHVLPFCERLKGQPIVQRIARQSIEWKWQPEIETLRGDSKQRKHDGGGNDASVAVDDATAENDSGKPRKDCPAYQNFNGTRLAELLASSKRFPSGRHLVILGDSTMEHMWASLVCLVGSKNVDREDSLDAREEQDVMFHDLQAHELMRKAGVLALKGGGRIIWLRSNHIVSEKTGNVESKVISISRTWRQEKHKGHGNLADSADSSHSPVFHYTEREIPWARHLRRGSVGQGDIVVFNSGAHGDLTQSRVRNALVFFRDYFPGSVYYRANVPGSPNCLNGTFSGSSGWSDKRKGKGQKVRHHHDGPMWYNWGLFQKFDNMWVDSARTILPRMRTLDVRQLSVERRDAHPGLVFGKMDCLHFCLPGGPVDEWNTILFNDLLRRDRFKEWP